MTYYIERVVAEIAQLENVNLETAFEKLLDYMAVHMMMGSDATSRLKSTTAEYLDAYIDFDMFRESNCDFLGEYYFSNILQKRDLFKVVNYDTINSDINKKGFPTGFFVSNIATGCKAIELSKKAGKLNIIMYAKSDDITMYRICLINKYLYDLPLFVLYVDTNYKKSDMVDMHTDSINWTYANRWNPTKASLLKTMS